MDSILENYANFYIKNMTKKIEKHCDIQILFFETKVISY